MPQRNRNTRSKTPSATEYSKRYFVSYCGGYKEFLQGQISRRHRQALQYLQPRRGDDILDIGCGRGELVKESRRMGANAIGIDYAPAAVKMATEYLSGSAAIIQADATLLPFSDNSFDKIVMLDVVEHLDKDDLMKCLAEIKRVLKRDGWVLIHSPNLWGEILERVYRRIFSRYHLTAEASDYEHLHVNLLTPMALRKILTQFGLTPSIWFAADSLLEDEPPFRIVANKLLWFTTSMWCQARQGI